MSTLQQCYPTLRAAAGSDAALLTKFPFLCTIEVMAEALSNSSLLGDARKNPNGYDKFEMAENICDYIDLHSDYATGKLPTAIVNANQNKYYMSQPKYWDNLNSGLYTVGSDPGFGATAVTKTGNGHHYTSAPTVTGSAPTGTIYEENRNATFSSTLLTASFVENVSTGLSSVYPSINTANTGITSDDIKGISYEIDNLTGTDPAGNDLDLDGWHYPMGLPGVSQISIGGPGDIYTSNDVLAALDLTQSEIDTAKSSFGFTGSPIKKTYDIGVPAYVAPFVHFAPDAGFSNKVNSLSGGGSDVAPTYKFIGMPDLTTVTHDHTMRWERAAGTGVGNAEIFDIYALTSTAGVQIPAGSDINAMRDTNTNSTSFLTAPAGDWWEADGTSTARIYFNVNSIADTVSTYQDSGAGNDQHWRGVPMYEISIDYTPSGGTITTGLFKVPFHYLATYNLINSGGSDATDMSISLANETVGITGDCTADYVDSSSTTQTATAHQGPFSIDTMSVLDAGAGYQASDTITATFPVGQGRHYQGLRLDPNVLSVRSNNNPTIKNEQTRATATTTNGALPRPLDIITHGNTYQGINTKDYLEVGFFGTDYLYEKDRYTRAYTISNNLITGVSATGTDNDTAGSLKVPGLEYGPSDYHDAVQPYGSNGTYMDVPNAGFGEASNVYWDKSSASFDIAISNGKVTGFTARSRTDGEGTSLTGGWGYNSNGDYTPLFLYRDDSVSLPADYIEPRMFIRTNVAADNGSGFKATVDINNADLEFYPGRNVPDGAFQYAFATAGGEKAPVVNPDDVTPDAVGEWYNRNWGRNVIQPKSVRIQVERPTLVSTTRSFKSILVGTGAHRYTFELEYPPMDQTDAETLINLFDKYKGPANEIVLFVPHIAMKHLGHYSYYTNTQMSKRPTISAQGELGSNQIVVDGFQNNGSVPTAGTLFIVNGQSKVYKIVEAPSSADSYGKVELLIEPPLLTNSTGQFLLTDDGFTENADFFKPRVHIMDDKIEYRIGADGLYRLSPIKFRESLA